MLANEKLSLIAPLIRESLTPDHVDVVRALIELGAKVNSEDLHKTTPLHLAAEGGK